MRQLRIIHTLLYIILIALIISCEKPDSSTSSGNSGYSIGRGGSYARFAIVNNHLYTISYNYIVTYDISNPDSIIEVLKEAIVGTDIGRDAETIFAYNNNLFIGARFGMIVYSLTNPAKPTYIGRMDHILSCDPVVAQGDYAYLTLNGASECRGINRLYILNIANPTNPYLAKSLNMVSPRGLGIDNKNLFVCDANNLFVYNLNNPSLPAKINTIEINVPYDVIPYNNNLVLSAQGGIYQYDYSNPTELKLNSRIPVVIE